MLIEKGMSPVCVLEKIHLEGMRLSKKFISDIADLFLDISQGSIAVDLFSGLITREMTNRILSKKSCQCLSCGGGKQKLCHKTPFEAAKAFSLICAIMLRKNISLHLKSKSQSRFLSWEERQKILSLCLEYGIQCADGSCCNIIQDLLVRPIEVGPDHRIQFPLFKEGAA